MQAGEVCDNIAKQYLGMELNSGFADVYSLHTYLASH